MFSIGFAKVASRDEASDLLAIPLYENDVSSMENDDFSLSALWIVTISR